MIYICEDCGFLFVRVDKVTECPYCEETHIRSADDNEAKKLRDAIK